MTKLVEVCRTPKKHARTRSSSTERISFNFCVFCQPSQHMAKISDWSVSKSVWRSHTIAKKQNFCLYIRHMFHIIQKFSLSRKFAMNR